MMLLTVTPSLRAEEAEKMRPLRYHTTRGGGLPRSTKKYTVSVVVCLGLIAIYTIPNHEFCL